MREAAHHRTASKITRAATLIAEERCAAGASSSAQAGHRSGWPNGSASAKTACPGSSSAATCSSQRFEATLKPLVDGCHSLRVPDKDPVVLSGLASLTDVPAKASPR